MAIFLPINLSSFQESVDGITTVTLDNYSKTRPLIVWRDRQAITSADGTKVVSHSQPGQPVETQPSSPLAAWSASGASAQPFNL